MSDKIIHRSPRSDVAPWEPPDARLDRQLFAQGAALLAAGQGKELEADVLQAYWFALSDVEPADFVAGVRLALQRERFVTPAAVYEACAEARGERQSREASARWRARQEQEEAERAERHKAFEAREEALHAQVDAWTTPPATVEELRDRMLVLLELRRRPAAEYVVRNAEVSGSMTELVLTVARASFFRQAGEILSEVATEAAGHPVRVTVRQGGAA